jgi:hypothetical protein
MLSHYLELFRTIGPLDQQMPDIQIVPAVDNWLNRLSSSIEDTIWYDAGIGCRSQWTKLRAMWLMAMN